MGENDMKEMDCVEIIVEKNKYAKEGVHKGMQGWICDCRCINGMRLVCFPQNGEKDNVATIPVKEDDLKSLPKGVDARVNERIKTEFGE